MVDFLRGYDKILCRACRKWKDVTFFLLAVFLHPNELHELTIFKNLSNENHYILVNNKL